MKMKRIFTKSIKASVILLIIFKTSYMAAQQRDVASLPPMGWNSWNCMGVNIDEGKVKSIAETMVRNGMKDAGYQYVVIDDGWQKGTIPRSGNKLSYIAGRDEDGQLIADPEKFPSGIKALSEYIHSLGLKFGIYTAPGEATCACRTGSSGYEEIDIKTFVDWGVDFIKLDMCGCEEDYRQVLEKWNRLLNECGRPIVLSVNIGRGDDYTIQMRTANMYRTTTDLSSVWSFPPEQFRTTVSITDDIDMQVGLEQYQGKGHWCDPDMLQVGNGALTTDENKSHFSMWAMFGAPLFTGNNLSRMSEEILNILTNKEIIAIAQDPAGTMGIKVSEDIPGLEVYSKKLYKTDEQAVALLNRTDKETEITVNWYDIGIKGEAFVRDLWEHEDNGLYKDKYTATVPSHGIVVLKIMANQYISMVPRKNFVKKSDIQKDGLLIECENKHCNWNASIDNAIKRYSGTGYVKGVDRKYEWARLRVTWRANLEQGGNYRLTFRYLNRNGRNLLFSCDKSEKQVLFKQGDNWQTVSVEVSLKDGINWIQLVSPDGNNENIAIDFLKIETL
jgi:alpha-galactosidase